MDRCVFPLFQQAATVWLTNWLFEGPVPIPVRVYWRWFWSPPWGHSSGAAICHLDCMAASLGGAPWLLIVYRLRCFRLHKGHMHRARWWAYTLIMSLYLCAGRSGTIRPPSGSPLLSAAMLFLHKYSPLFQLSLAYYNTHTHREKHTGPLVKKQTQIYTGHVKAVLIHLHTHKQMYTQIITPVSMAAKWLYVSMSCSKRLGANWCWWWHSVTQQNTVLLWVRWFYSVTLSLLRIKTFCWQSPGIPRGDVCWQRSLDQHY